MVKVRIAGTVSQEIAEAIEKIAKERKASLSSILEYLLFYAIQAYKNGKVNYSFCCKEGAHQI